MTYSIRIDREEFITVCGDGIDNEALNFNQFVQDYIDKDDDGDCDRDLIEESRQQNSDANLNRSDGKVFQTKSTANRYEKFAIDSLFLFSTPKPNLMNLILSV